MKLDRGWEVALGQVYCVLSLSMPRCMPPLCSPVHVSDCRARHSGTGRTIPPQELELQQNGCLILSSYSFQFKGFKGYFVKGLRFCTVVQIVTKVNVFKHVGWI